MKRGQPDPSRLQTTHLGEVVWSGHCGSTQESPALLQLWHLTGGVTSLLLLQLWHLILGNNCPSAPALVPDWRSNFLSPPPPVLPCPPVSSQGLWTVCGGYVESCLEASPDPKNTETNKNPSTFKSYCLSNIG